MRSLNIERCHFFFLLKIVVEAAMAANPSTQKLALSLSTTQTPGMDTTGSEKGEWKSPIKCKAFVASKDVYCGRANTIPNYFEINRYVS